MIDLQKQFKIMNLHGSINNWNNENICVLMVLLFQLDLVLKSDGGDLSDFTTNGEWYLLGKYYLIWFYRN